MFVKVLRSGAFVLVAAAALFYAYKYYELKMAYTTEHEANATLNYQIGEFLDKLKASNTANIELGSQIDDLKTLLEARTAENQTKEQQVQQLSTTVSTLDKLTKTDKELLEKYSSVYFLNENYVPASLSPIEPFFLNRPTKPEQILSGIGQHLNDLLNAAKKDNTPLQILSAYRSFGTQAALKTGYKVTYGAGTANSFSADQGYSEHQLGTAVDFTTPVTAATLVGFDKTTSYTWLTAHAYEYGFILSYPKGNTHFVFEPWHWRYVGIELAKKLHDENKYFYDLDQRDIDTYLIKFFD